VRRTTRLKELVALKAAKALGVTIPQSRRCARMK
jgi:hypothetical protein